MSALSLGGHSENGFSLDPSSTQAFKAIGSLKDHLVHRKDSLDPSKPVSYTHLTLPTIA